MKKIEWMMLGNIVITATTLSTASEPLPPLEPAKARQVHYLLDSPSLSEAEFSNLGHHWADSAQAVVLTLIEGTPTSTLPWPFAGELPSSATVLRTARTWLDGTSEFCFVVPSASLPVAWGVEVELNLEIDGQTHAISADSVMIFPAASPAVTLVQIGLHATLADGSVRSSAAILQVRSACPIPSPDLPPWPSEAPALPWWVGTFFEGQAVTGSAFVKLGADGVFDAPVILCDGFDPDLHQHVVPWGHGDQTWETLWDCNLSYRSVLEDMLSTGLDVVFVDWASGTRAVEENAALLQEVIALCNNYKLGTTPCAVVGMSMGGVISQIALRQMELQGLPHCTGLFVACDSPLRGAYLPWSMLQAIEFFSVISSEAHALHLALQSPAAQQLLYIRPGGTPLAHLQMVQSLEAMGLPEDCTNASIVNSHPNSSFPVSPGPLLHASESLWGWEWAHVQLQPLPGDPFHSASSLTANVTFDASLPNAEAPWNDLFLDALGFCPADFPGIESLPGSKTAHLDAFRSALEAGGLSVPVCQTETMFIPTFSALGLPSGSLAPSPFDWIHTENQFTGSTTHCDLTQHGEVLLDWLVANATGGSAVLGHNNPFVVHLPTTPIETATIGSTEGSGDAGWGQGPFLGELAVCAAQTNIGSSLVIGSSDESLPGTLEVKAGQKLVLNPSSTLSIGPGSTLTIRSGGRLVIQDFAVATILGQLIIEPNAIIETHNGVTIHLEANSSEWLHMGTWILPSASEVNLAGGPGHMTTGDETAPEIHLGPQSQINWSGGAGYSTPQLVLKVGTGSDLTFTGSGLIAWETARVHLASSAQLIADDCLVRLESSRVSGDGSYPIARPVFSSNDRIRLLQTSIQNIDTDWNLDGPGALWAWESTFEQARIHCTSGGGTIEACTLKDVFWSWEMPMSHVALHACEFDGGFSSAHPMLKITGGSEPIRLFENEWHSHRDGLWLIDVSQVALKCNQFWELELALYSKGTFLLMNGPSGGNNRFEENDVHLRFELAPPPLLSGGTNEFGAYSMALALGDLLMPLGPGEAAQPLNASFQIWENGAPEFETTGLVSSHPSASGLPIHLIDPSPEFVINCDSDSPPQEASEVKSQLNCTSIIPTMRTLKEDARSRMAQSQSTLLNLWGQSVKNRPEGAYLIEHIYTSNGQWCRSIEKFISVQD